MEEGDTVEITVHCYVSLSHLIMSIPDKKGKVDVELALLSQCFMFIIKV